MGSGADTKPEEKGEVKKPCTTCESLESFKPSHYGSAKCESGSIASGGNKTHCSCNTCF